MVRRDEDVVEVQGFENAQKELGGEESSFVGDEFLRNSVVKVQFMHEELAYLGCAGTPSSVRSYLTW